MGPIVCCRTRDTCYRWCFVLEGVVVAAVAVMKTATAEAAVAKALVLRACALADKELL
jgi:hypothetical protein